MNTYYGVRALLRSRGIPDEFDPMLDCRIVGTKDGEIIEYWNPRLGEKPTREQLDALAPLANTILAERKLPVPSVADLVARIDALEMGKEA